LGAGVNVSAPDREYVGLPLGAGVAEQLVSRLAPYGLDEDDFGSVYPTLAEIALAFGQDFSRLHLIEVLREILDEEALESSPMLRTLSKLPVSLIVTTNYDRLLERALAEAGREFLVISQPKGGFHWEERKAVDEKLTAADTPVVIYKLHGTFDDDVVIDEDDYIQLMAAMASSRTGLPLWIMRQLEHSALLFLGYSLRDWDFRLLYRSLQTPHRERPAYAVLRRPPRFWVHYLRALKIEVHDGDIYDFADELAARFDAFSTQRP